MIFLLRVSKKNGPCKRAHKVRGIINKLIFKIKFQSIISSWKRDFILHKRTMISCHLIKKIITKQSTTNYDQDDFVLGLLYGKNYKNYSFVFGISQLNREPLSASEIPGIAELALSGLGKTFKVLDDDQVNSGIYAGSYDKNTFVPDPNCEENGGYLDGSRCRFLYGERFNIVNKESHEKIYLNLFKEHMKSSSYAP